MYANLSRDAQRGDRQNLFLVDKVLDVDLDVMDGLLEYVSTLAQWRPDVPAIDCSRCLYDGVVH